jgi:glycosyltransferase involved in cell wall biosynthesis
MITVITPTYNRAELVQRTIRSVQDQTFKDWQYIIVDDGSTDYTEDAIQPYLEDKRITYVKKQNSGQADSLNVGASYAKGEFIVFLDSDDEAFPEWLKIVSENLKSDTGILSVGAIRKFFDGTEILEGMNIFHLFGKAWHLKFTCGSLFIRRSIFEAVKGYDTSLNSNIQTDLGYRLLTYMRTTEYNPVVVDDYLVQINVHMGERIRTNWNRRREGGMRFLQKHYDFLSQNDKKEISNIYAAIAFSCYKLKRRKESVGLLMKAIKHNPMRGINYLRVVRYAIS